MPLLPRLKKRREFLQVAQTRIKWVAPGFILQVRKRPKRALYTNALSRESHTGPANVRIGFTVSKKVGNAPERNRAKRRLRALADLVLSQTDVSGCDLVLIGRRETLVHPFKRMEKDLKKALRRTGLTEDGAPEAIRRPPLKETP